MIDRRALVLIPFGGKDRLAVVLDGGVDVVVVIAVTGTERALDRVHVDVGSRAAIALQLSKPTFFYASNIAAVPAALCRVLPRKCPPELHEQLLALRARASLAKR
ncbi:MAG: hypothetical protein M3Y87_01525 [Myxococcota bacterium]|nr:hypothetical protein [Myxococcota bacterium]